MPFSCHQIPYPLIIGIDISDKITNEDQTYNPFSLIKSQNFSKYDYIISPISPKNPIIRKQFLKNPTIPIFLDDYYLFSNSIFKSQFVAKLHDNDFNNIENNQQIIIQDLNYCNHLNVAGINIKYVSIKDSSNNFLFCEMIKNFIKANPDRKINIEVEFSQEGLNIFRKISSMTDDIENIRMTILLNKNSQITNIESDLFKEFISHRLYGVIIPLSIFMTNKNGFPVLSKVHQELVKELFKCKLELVIKDDIEAIKLENENSITILDDYYIYLTHLFQNHSTFNDNFECILNYYQDVLQTPLQPLRDNLQSQIYETFEEDTTKYTKYKESISKALNDLLEQREKDKIINIGIFGGGRGPLIRAVIQALNDRNIEDYPKENIFIFCVEKNINAYNTLLNLMNHEEIFSKVKMFCGDMRTFNPQKNGINGIDLCISELLGSFGDNELSPECLINIKQYMNTNGIMIPQEYSSFLHPVSCPRTWCNIKTIKDSYESPYIINFAKAFFPIKTIQKCLTFSHYVNNEKDDDFTQFKSLKFNFDKTCVITGFAGYFKAVLYKDVTLSICPGEEHTEGLVSWFPIYFPSYKQIMVNKGDDLLINIKRINNGRKVWYEWNFDISSDLVGFYSKIHNVDGEGYAILL